MFKSLLLAAVAIVGVSADISKFPSFDAFHVMYAGAALAEGADPAVLERLTRLVELARVSVFNERIRSLLPIVREHAARAQAAQAVALPAAKHAPPLGRIESERALVGRRLAGKAATARNLVSGGWTSTTSGSCARRSSSRSRRGSSARSSRSSARS